MTNHKRRDQYWKYYHDAHTRELDFLTSHIVSLIVENPCPAHAKRSGAGRKPVHDKNKLAFLCILMVCLDFTSRDMENLAALLRMPWNEPLPDHSTIAKFMQKIPTAWLEGIIACTAESCLAGFDASSKLKLASDSTGVATGRYYMVQKNVKNRHKSEVKRQKYIKWHVTAVLGLQVILSCRITASNVADTTVLASLIEKIKKTGIAFSGSRFNADKGYDSDENFRLVFDVGMTPNIKQRNNAISSSKPFRKRAAGLFDADIYKKRGMIEGIFGAEETEGHRLLCRFRKKSTRRRFGLCKAIGWNLEVLNRLECAARQNIVVVAA